MEPGTGGGSGRRRRLSDAGRDSLAGLTLGAVLGNDKRSTSQVSRTLLDIIRDEEPNNGAYKNLINHHNNKKSWKSFKDRLRLRRAGAAWTSSDDSPSSDNRMRSYRSSPQLTRRDSTCTPSQTQTQTISFESLEDANQPQDSSVICDPSTQTCSRPQFSRRNSVRSPSLTDQTQSATEFGDSLVVETVPVSDVPVQNNNRMNMLRRNSSHLPSYSTNSSQQQADPFDDYESAPGIRLSAALAAEREQIQRVVSSSEAAAASAESETEREREEEEEEEDGVHNTHEAAAPETEAVAAAQQQPVRMSLMDLLEETDRQMGWVSYMAEDDDEEAEEEVDERGGAGGAGVEYNCCVCMVRHKGSAFIPCGHTFCRLCSRELWVSRGNCPLCNGYILEILDIF